MKKLENNIYAKISLSIVSLLLTLIIAEIGLKTFGKIYNLSYQNEYIPNQESSDYIRDEMYESYSLNNKNKDIVLSIGDSFTNAGNVESKYSYPHQLFNLLIKNKKPTKVLNMGLCEDSTFGVNKRLQNFFKEEDKSNYPSKVLVLIGAADNFERYHKESVTEIKPWYQVSKHSWYKDLSIYKVVRHIRYHYIQKELTGEIENERLVSSKEFDEVKGLYLELKEDISKKNKYKDIRYFQEKLPEGFKKYCNSLHIEFKTKYQILHSLSVYMSKILASQFKHDRAFHWLLDLANFNPRMFWGGDFDDAYFRIVQTFHFQSEISTPTILLDLERMLSQDKSLESVKHFTEFYELVKNKDKVMRETDISRRAAWKEIIALSKLYKFELYMLNYPSNYISANSIIKKVSKENNIKLIDLNHYFNSLILKNSREKYLEDDDHLTPLGYKLMADEIYKAIN